MEKITNTGVCVCVPCVVCGRGGGELMKKEGFKELGLRFFWLCLAGRNKVGIYKQKEKREKKEEKRGGYQKKSPLPTPW